MRVFLPNQVGVRDGINGHGLLEQAIEEFPAVARLAPVDDPDHSVGERRLMTIGFSVQGRLVVVCHTERGSAVRIISARPATARERKRHET